MRVNMTVLLGFPAALTAAAFLPASVTIALLAVAMVWSILHHTRTRNLAGHPKKNGLGVTSTEAEYPER